MRPETSILFLGNRAFDSSLDASGFPSQGDCGNCYAKISSTSPLRLLDYFTPLNTVAASAADEDFASGGPLLLPGLIDATGTTRHLAVGSGKDANIYVLDPDNRKFNPNQDNVYELISGRLAAGEFAKPSDLTALSITAPWEMRSRPFGSQNARLAVTPSSQSSNLFPYPGTMPSISARGVANGIVWAVENGSTIVRSSFTLTMPRILRQNSITPTKLPTAATNPPATNSSRL